jgi:hypothetical protein
MRYNIKPDSFAKLKRNHLLVGAFYMLFGLFIFIGSFTIQALKDFKPDLFLNYITKLRVGGSYYNPEYQITVGDITGNSTYISRLVEMIKDVPFMLIVGIILLVSALIHITVTTRRLNPVYNSNLQNNVPKPIFMDSLFTSLLLPLLAIIIGVANLNIVLLLFVLGLVASVLTYNMKQLRILKAKPSWASYIGMVLAFLGAFAVFLLSRANQLQIQQALLDNLTITEPYLKSFNYTIMFVYFGFWFIKLVHNLLDNLNLKWWKNPVFVETVHIIISLLLKIAIIGMIFYGLVNNLFTIFYQNL